MAARGWDPVVDGWFPYGPALCTACAPHKANLVLLFPRPAGVLLGGAVSGSLSNGFELLRFELLANGNQGVLPDPLHFTAGSQGKMGAGVWGHGATPTRRFAGSGPGNGPLLGATVLPFTSAPRPNAPRLRGAPTPAAGISLPYSMPCKDALQSLSKLLNLAGP